MIPGLYRYEANENNIEKDVIECYLNLTSNLPKAQVVLQCSSFTSIDEINAFYYRMVLCQAKVLFTIFKVVSTVREAARRAAEKLHEQILKDDEEVKEVVEKVPAVVEEPTPSAEVVLLTEIRDLLRKKENE